MYIIDICELFTVSSDIHIFVTDDDDGYGTTYCFPSDDIPEELEDVEIDSIDNPYFCEKSSPLVFNVSSESFEDYEQFRIDFADKEVKN